MTTAAGGAGAGGRRPGFGAGLGAGVRHGFRAGQQWQAAGAPPPPPPPQNPVVRGVTGVENRQPLVPTQWSPDPTSVLVFGLALVGANLWAGGGLDKLGQLVWQPGAVATSNKIGRQIAGECIFVGVLYVLATISPALARASTVFIFGLWGIFLLFYGPIIAGKLATFTGSGGGA